MALPHLPSKTFTGSTENIDAEGTATIDQVNDDQDEQNIMMRPDLTHKNGDKGGIHKGNLNDESGIYTDESSLTIDQALAGGATEGTIVQLLGWITRQIKALGAKTNWFDAITGIASSNISTATGKTLADALESDGLKAKTSTLADAAKGDTRFQVSVSASGGTNVVYNSPLSLAILPRLIPTGKSLKLKRVSYYVGNSNLRMYVSSSDSSWTSSGYSGEETPDVVLTTGDNTVKNINLRVLNTDSGSSHSGAPYPYSCWADLAIE